MADTAPGTFSTPTLAPIFVGGMPLPDLVDALKANDTLLAAQKQTDEAHFWSTPRRPSTDATRDVFEVNLSTAKTINAISLDLARFPHKAYFFYRSPKTGAWLPLLAGTNHRPLVASIGDSLPAVIVPFPAGGGGHPQHYGAGHWIHQDLTVAPVTASQFRVVLVRQHGKVPKDISRKAVPYSLGVRAFNIGYKVHGRNDLPRTNRDPVIVTETESFTSTTDMLGSPVSLSVRENRAQDLLKGAMWKCEPQPIPNAVVNLYVDARTSTGAPQIVDRFYLDPITTGVHMNIYHSNDVPQPGAGSFVASDDPLSFPLTRVNGVVRPTSGGLSFPDDMGYLDIDNAALQFDPSGPFWLGMVLQPRFSSTDQARHVFIDCGALRVEWTGAFLQATLGESVMLRDDIPFSASDLLSLVVGSDGTTMHLYIQGQDRTTEVSMDSSALPATIRLGGLLGGSDTDPGHGNFLLESLILKEEQPPDPSTYETYFADYSGFATKPLFPGDDTGTTDNALLRYDVFYQTAGDGSINPFGLVGGTGNRYEELSWTPISRDFTLNKGFCVFNPTQARFFKFEFTNLTAQPYDEIVPVARKVQVFPTAMYYPGVGLPQAISASGNKAGGGAVTSQVASSTVHYADEVRTFTAPTVPTGKGTYKPTETLFSRDPVVAGRLRRASIYYNFQQWHQSKYSPRFVAVQKHVYETVEVEHSSRVAYFVGLSSIEMFRVDYSTNDDAEQYIENFQDAAHLVPNALDGGWTLGDEGLSTPSNLGLDSISVQSVVFPSRRKVVGLQYATQQSTPLQLMADPDFNDVALTLWRGYGDASIASTTDFTSDVGSMVQVTRNQTSNYWNTIQSRFASWDAIENSDPDPSRPTWSSLEITSSSVSFGGIESIQELPIAAVGRLYAAARVFAPKALTAPVYVQIVSQDGTVLAEDQMDVAAGQVAEWFTSYTVGEGGTVTPLTWDQVQANNATWDAAEAEGSWDNIDVSTQTLVGSVHARVIQQDPTDDVFYVDNLSVFEDSLIWEFSNDNGVTWYRVYDIRNDPHGIFMFPDSGSQGGRGLCWRVTGTRPDHRVNALVIRPIYDSLPLGVPYRESIQSGGPNQALFDHYPAITDDARFKAWDKPVPQEWWFVFRQWMLQQNPQHSFITSRSITAPQTIIEPLKSGDVAKPLFLIESIIPPTGG